MGYFPIYLVPYLVVVVLALVAAMGVTMLRKKLFILNHHRNPKALVRGVEMKAPHGNHSIPPDGNDEE